MGDNSIIGAVAAASVNLCVYDSIPVRDHVINTVQSYSIKDKQQIWLWHRRLGHPSFGYLKRLFPSLLCSCDESSFKCETCILAKSHRTMFPLSDSKATKPFDLVHSDMWGPARITWNGFRWFATFIDDCTRLTWVFLLKNKHDVASIILEFCTMVSTQFHARVKVFRTDNKGEYVNNTLTSFFRAQASDRSPISDDETYSPCEETTDRPLELNQLPISGDEAGALGVETTGHNEASDQSPVSENNDSYSCMDEFDAIPPSALPVPQSTRDSESSEVISNDLSCQLISYSHEPLVENLKYNIDIHAKSKYPISHFVSTHRLSKLYASYLCQLSSVCVPTKL
ncbi:hypothetical protein L3X38_037203 [Prunus dulcis]|uniref:Integrase catalytic domain-containing protein n=1 Tax=Prunus dulcis TaxID=3755 RepID=A0AAD4YQ66_PRUDU|nr:hypothetical protein L3X38_037203 [Prunus dulcis]